MFKATREIYEALKAEEGLKVFTDDQGRRSSVWLQFAVKKGTRLSHQLYQRQ